MYLSRNYFSEMESRSLSTDYNQKSTKLLIIHANATFSSCSGGKAHRFYQIFKEVQSTHKKDKKYCPSQKKHKKQKQVNL